MNHPTFAKLFNFESIGQIVVIKQNNDDANPEVRLFFQPPEDLGLGVCNYSFSWEDDDLGHAAQDKCFDDLTADVVAELVQGLIDQVTDSGLRGVPDGDD